VVLRYRIAGREDNPVLGPASVFLLRTLHDFPAIKIARILDDEFDPFLEEEGWRKTLMDASRFTGFVDANRDVDAIVIVGGTPQLSAADVKTLGPSHPKIIAASVLTPPARWLLADHVIESAIISHSVDIREPPRTPREWFDRRYRIVGAQDAGGLP